MALGAGRGRLLRLLLTESVTLALVGALASVPVAYAVGTILRRVLLPQVAWAGEPVDLRILALTSAVALLMGLLVGALPARAAQRIDIRGGLASERAGRSRNRTRTQTALATLQVALSAALLMSAGLFLKSFATMRLTDLGLDARAVEAVSLRPLEAGALEQGSEEERTAYLGALATARAHPGVERAALSLGVPFMYHFGTSVHVPGRDSVAAVPGKGSLPLSNS